MKVRVCALAVLFAPAVAAAGPRAVTVDDVRAAAAKSPEQVAAHGRTLAADADAEATGPWPTTGLEVHSAIHTARFVAVASVPLPVMGLEQAERRTARAEADVARAEESTTAADVRARATAAWLELYRADQLATIASESADRMASLAEVTRKRKDAGDASAADVANAAIVAQRAKVDADSATMAASSASSDLDAEVGWDPDDELTATGPLPGGTAPGDDALDAKVASHPEMRAQERRIDAALAAVDEAHASNRPALHLTAEVDAFDPNAGVPTDILFGVAVDLPLFGREHKKIAAAQAHVAAEHATADAIERRLTGEVIAAQRRWRAAAQRSAAFRDQLVPAQEASTDLVRKAYQAGEVDLSTVIQAERDLLDVKGESIDAEVGAAEAWTELEHAAGGPL